MDLAMILDAFDPGKHTTPCVSYDALMNSATPADATARTAISTIANWWRSAVIYQVYIRSFRDGSGDGIGDIAGIRECLPYISELGVDALWINPWYPSPMKDAGYDVANYRDIEPLFGTLDEASLLIAEAHVLGLKVILDIVPNHSSDRHAWFQTAIASSAGSAERERYVFRPGRGEHGELPPNDWQSVFPRAGVDSIARARSIGRRVVPAPVCTRAA